MQPLLCGFQEFFPARYGELHVLLSAGVYESCNSQQDTFGISHDLAFPDHKYSPQHLAEFPLIRLVSFNSQFELLLPESLVVGWGGAIAATPVTMPNSNRGRKSQSCTWA